MREPLPRRRLSCYDKLVKIAMDAVIIPNPDNLEKIKSALAAGGADKLHVLADFDRTMTTAFVDGKPVPSLIYLLRAGNYLTPDYAAKAHALYEKYSPLERAPDLSLEEKQRAMREWWMTHFELLIKSGLNKKDIERAIGSGKIRLRLGAPEFLDTLRERGIPLVILSSTGLGGEAIKLCLAQNNRFYDNIHIISNSFAYDESGRAVRVNEPIIHSLNKDESALRDLPDYEAIKNRPNILLLGDGPGDADMAAGSDGVLLKIGFFNTEKQELLEAFKEKFDAIIMNDGTFEYVNDLLKEIL